jgi:integrase
MSRHTSFFLLANTGMRRGELLGLRWCDLGLESRRLSVCQALVSVAYDVEISDVKTGTGRRTIDIDDGTVQAVRDWFNSRTEERDGVAGVGLRPRWPPAWPSPGSTTVPTFRST